MEPSAEAATLGLALVLGAGGARGLAHVGALHCIRQGHMQFDAFEHGVLPAPIPARVLDAAPLDVISGKTTPSSGEPAGTCSNCRTTDGPDTAASGAVIVANTADGFFTGMSPAALW